MRTGFDRTVFHFSLHCVSDSLIPAYFLRNPKLIPIFYRNFKFFQFFFDIMIICPLFHPSNPSRAPSNPNFYLVPKSHSNYHRPSLHLRMLFTNNPTLNEVN